MSGHASSEGTFTVGAELGLHARPAGAFVTLAARFEARVEVSRDGDDEWVDGSSILSLLSLAAANGTALRIRATGPDARRAVAALGRLIETPSCGQEPAA